MDILKQQALIAIFSDLGGDYLPYNRTPWEMRVLEINVTMMWIYQKVYSATNQLIKLETFCFRLCFSFICSNCISTSSN